MKKPSRYLLLVLIGAAIGLLFASVSTRDFAMHLDRQVHDVNCSFTPGLSGPSSGETGCLVTMVSPYSSVFRSSVWGGVPISLPAMAVFAFLLALGAEILVSGRQRSPAAMGFLALATALPMVTSLIMASISMFSLDAVCKICVGIYFGSALVFAGGLGGFLKARRDARGASEPERKIDPRTAGASADEGSDDPAWVTGGARSATEPPEPAKPARHVTPAVRPREVPGADARYLGAAFAVGVFFVAVPVLAYMKSAPDHGKYIGACGSLPEPDLDESISLPIGPKGKVPAIEVLDPLCPACRQFESRLEQTGLDAELDRRAVLFPLDSTCNWMIDESVHPGACAISEAMLCAGPRAEEVLRWSFAEQENIMAATKADATAAARMVTEEFPEVADCLGKTEVKSRLNRALRWAVDNQIQVLTPQLYIGGVKLCDEDVDLGLAFSLTEMIERHESGTLRATGEASPPLVEEAEAEAPEAEAEEPKTEEPKTEEPKTEEPKTEEPKTEEPKTEVEAPKPEADPAPQPTGGETP